MIISCCEDGKWMHLMIVSSDGLCITSDFELSESITRKIVKY
jgi:hypothetical protein